MRPPPVGAGTYLRMYGKLPNCGGIGPRLRSAMCKSEVGAPTWQSPLADARATIHPGPLICLPAQHLRRAGLEARLQWITSDD